MQVLVLRRADFCGANLPHFVQRVGSVLESRI
jgi:hypothetical protein